MSALWPALSPCPWDDAERCWDDAEALIADGYEREATARLGQACVGGYELACEHWAWRVARDADRDGDDLAAGRAAWVQRDLCAWRKGVACYNAGQSFRRGKGVAVDHAEAMRLFDRGCHDLDQHQACAALAFHYLEGLGVPKDPNRGRRLLEGSCEADNAVACFNLGKVLVDLTEEGPRGAAQIRRAIAKACRLGHAKACDLLGAAEDPEPGDEAAADPDSGTGAALSRLRGLAAPGASEAPATEERP